MEIKGIDVSAYNTVTDYSAGLIEIPNATLKL